MNRKLFSFFVFCVLVFTDVAFSTQETTPAPLPPSYPEPLSLSISMRDGNVLEAKSGVEVVIKEGTISLYVSQNSISIPVKNGQAQIPPDQYTNPVINNLLKPYKGAILLLIKGNSSISIGKEYPSSGEKMNLPDGYTLKQYYIQIEKGKIKTIHQMTAVLNNYKGNLLRFKNGDKINDE